MFIYSKLTKILNSSKEINFDDSSRIVFMSDCHRGDGSWKDNLAHNRNVYYSALEYYFKNDYTYIELGDGDELWENRTLIDIWNIYEEAFRLLNKFYLKNRLYMIFGNHDKAKRLKSFINKNKKLLFKNYYYKNDLIASRLYENLEISEGLILKHSPTNKKILAIHGHQGDILNDNLWFISRFAVRYVWSVLEGVLGFKDPTSPAKNYRKKDYVEKNIIKWVSENNCMVVAGHTHRPYFPKLGKPSYFNDGSCVHPYSTTAIEINSGQISLVKWQVNVREDSTLYVHREILEGPVKLTKYLYPIT